ncbi:MAG: MFS transporter, partial [Bacillota bacterium]|nr:MFS transporter [Bacillota bacterium]
MVLGNSMLIPVFPQMKKAMDLTQFQVGLIVTFFSIPAGILIPLAGFLSDR